jgi:hypothetical protein
MIPADLAPHHFRTVLQKAGKSRVPEIAVAKEIEPRN